MTAKQAKLLSVLLTILSLASGVLMYVVRAEAKAQVSQVSERVARLEAVLPQIREDIRYIREDVEWMRRNFFARDELLNDPGWHVQEPR